MRSLGSDRNSPLKVLVRAAPPPTRCIASHSILAYIFAEYFAFIGEVYERTNSSYLRLTDTSTSGHEGSVH